VIDIERRSIGCVHSGGDFIAPMKTTRLKLLFTRNSSNAIAATLCAVAAYSFAYFFSARLFNLDFRSSEIERAKKRGTAAGSRQAFSINILRKHANLSNYRISDANENARINQSAADPLLLLDGTCPEPLPFTFVDNSKR